MAVLKRKDVNLHYEVIGETGAWATLINGYTRPGSDFRMFAKKLVNAGFRALIFDNRGAGQTDFSKSFTLEDMADDVMALWYELGITESHVLGISMGGVIAQILAQAEQTQSLTLISSTASSAFLTDDRGWPASMIEIEKKLKNYFDLDFSRRNKVLIEMMAKNIHKQVSGQNFVEKAKAQSQALSSYQWNAECPEMLPLLIIHGENDNIIPVQAAHEMKSRYPHAALVTFKECGHLLLAENLSGILEKVSGFWA